MVAWARKAKRHGFSQRAAARYLGIAPSTLNDWDQQWKTHTFGLRPLGRPACHEPRIVRVQVKEMLEESSGIVSVAQLKREFPDVPIVRLKRLRRAYRRHRRSSSIRLTWTTVGSVWAADYTELKRAANAKRRWGLVVRDLASGIVLGAQHTRHATAECTCQLLRDLFIEYGAPLVLKTDNGSHFTAGIVGELLAEDDVQQLLSPTYFPQYNGAIESGMNVLKPRLYTVADDPHNTTQADLDRARFFSNEWPCERRRTSANERWEAGHRPVLPDDRTAFRAAVAAERTRYLAELDETSRDLLETNQKARATVARRALERALAERGYLKVRRSRNARSST